MVPRSTKAPTGSSTTAQVGNMIDSDEMEWVSTLELRSGKNIDRGSSGWGVENLTREQSDAEDDPRMKLFSPVLAQVRFEILPKFVRAVRRYYDDADRCPPENGLDGLDPDALEFQGYTVELDGETQSEDEKVDDDETKSGREEDYEWETDSELSSDGSVKFEKKTYTDEDEEMADEEQSYSHVQDLGGVCSVTVGSPIFGRLHVLFPLEFEDGIKWIIKIPINGTPSLFDDASQRALRTEALTMDLLKRKTTIPLPRVFGFETTCSNEINCPFILMEFISGKPLSEYWYHNTAPEVKLERYRNRILKDIGEAMFQLRRFSFNEAGFPEFDDLGELTGEVGPLRFLRQRLRIDDEPRNRWRMPLYVMQGPFENTVDFFQALVKLHRRPNSELGMGALRFLRMMLFHMPEETGPVLAHPDLDFRNIIASEGGEIAAFIGWTDVCVVPRCIGNEAYPRWLLSDCFSLLEGPRSYNVFNYPFPGSPEDGFREQYNVSMVPTYSQRRRFNHTLNSHLTMSLYIASQSPEHTMTLVESIFKGIVNITGPIKRISKFKTICHAVQKGRIIHEEDTGVENALEDMLSPPVSTTYRQRAYFGLWADRDLPPSPEPYFPFLD